MAKKECWVSIAVDGRIDVCIKVEETATKEEIQSLAMAAFCDTPLEEMECISANPVNYTFEDGELVDF